MNPDRHQDNTRPADAAAPLLVALAWAAQGAYVGPCCWPTADGRCGCGKGHTGQTIGKAPLPEHGVHDFTDDPATIRAWWARWPQANVAVDLARSGLAMVDPDSLEALDDAVQSGLPPAQTRMSRHPAFLYDRPPDCPATRSTKLGPDGHLDLLASGYAVVHGTHQSGAPIYTSGTRRSPLPLWAVVRLQQAAERRDRVPVQFQGDPQAALHGQALWPTIRDQLPARIVAAVEGGPDAYVPRTLTAAERAQGWRPPDRSRSGADAAICTALVRAGLGDQQVYILYAAYPCGTTGKFAGRGGVQYLARTLSAARGWMAQHPPEIIAGPATTPDPEPPEIIAGPDGETTEPPPEPPGNNFRPQDWETLARELARQLDEALAAADACRAQAVAARAELAAYHRACCDADARTVAAITYELAATYRPAPHPDLPDGYAPLWVGERDQDGSLAQRTQKCSNQVRTVVERLQTMGHVELHRYQRPGPDGRQRDHLGYRVPVLVAGGSVADVLRALPPDATAEREARDGKRPGRPAACDTHPDGAVTVTVFDALRVTPVQVSVYHCQAGPHELRRETTVVGKTVLQYTGRRPDPPPAPPGNYFRDPPDGDLAAAARAAPINILAPAHPAPDPAIIAATPAAQKVAPSYTQRAVSARAPCPACGSRRWWPRPDGGEHVCGVCHPPPDGAEIISGAGAAP